MLKGIEMIYCDMDGVLCDFDRAIFEIDGKTRIEDLREGDPELDLWKHIQKQGNIAKFYTDLEWHPEGKKLWNYLQDLVNVEILTSLGGSNPDKEGARYGKEIWLKNRNIDVPLNFSQKAANKQFWVNNKNDVLIDDYEPNIRQWNQAGGIGIFFTTAAEVIEKLNGLKERN
jgi:hypothetical protein